MLTLGNLEGGRGVVGRWGWAAGSGGPGRKVANPKVTCGDAAKELGVSHATMRRLLKEDLGRKHLRNFIAKRAKPVNAANRLAICHTWKEQLESGSSTRGRYIVQMGNCSALGHAQETTKT